VRQPAAPLTGAPPFLTVFGFFDENRLAESREEARRRGWWHAAPMTGWIFVGTALTALPALLALSWAHQRRVFARYLLCLGAGLVGAAGMAALFAMVGARLTYDPAASSELGNWSGILGAALGLLLGWVAGAVAAPAVLLRVLGTGLDATRLLVGVVVGAVISGVLVYAMLALHVGDGPQVWPMRALAALSSVATFVGLVLAAREPTAF
jgi:hypothetical protein